MSTLMVDVVDEHCLSLIINACAVLKIQAETESRSLAYDAIHDYLLMQLNKIQEDSAGKGK